MESCSSCKFGLMHESGNLMCRRFPPTVEAPFVDMIGPPTAKKVTTYMTLSYHPVVPQGAWCGEYKVRLAS